MKHLKFYILIISALLCIFMFGCSELPQVDTDEGPILYSISFMANGKTYERSVVDSGRVVAKPNTDPTLTNHKFVGWCTDKEATELYDFTKPVTKSFTLYARFELDMDVLSQSIENAKYSIVKINNKNYNLDGEEQIDTKVQSGIGYIFNISNGYCFVVTNNHTVSIQNGFSNQEVTVEDYSGTTHEARFYKNPNKPQRAASNDYDLAVVCFKYSKNDLKVARLKNNTLSVNDIVVSIGADSSKATNGRVTKIEPYKSSIEEYLSNVTFNVIQHDSIIDDEMKESILFNLDLTVAGITYTTEDGYAYAISYSKIQAFLNEFVYE